MRAAETTLLLVEDDGLIRLDLADQLSDLGFIVLQASNADQALLVLERRSEISALLTDIDMPGSMSGLGLAAVVAERWPACKILVISGRHAPDPESLARGASFIAKPVTEAGLLRMLQRMALID